MNDIFFIRIACTNSKLVTDKVTPELVSYSHVLKFIELEFLAAWVGRTIQMKFMISMVLQLHSQHKAIPDTMLGMMSMEICGFVDCHLEKWPDAWECLFN